MSPDGKPLTRDELRAWLDRPPPKHKPEQCEHQVAVLAVQEPGPSLYGCVECNALWEVP